MAGSQEEGEPQTPRAGGGPGMQLEAWKTKAVSGFPFLPAVEVFLFFLPLTHTAGPDWEPAATGA